MKDLTLKILVTGLMVLVCAFLAAAQADVSRKTTAITYPLDETVKVQFRGTTRFPRMKGDATIKRTTRSQTRIELHVENMPRPFELGAGYATYVVWAISPEGQADNLGEIKRSGLFFIDSKLTVTTNLQTFAIIITAEPHFLVTRPSQAIMLENLYPVADSGKRIPTQPAIQYFGNSSDYFRDPRTPEIAEVDYARTPPSILQGKQAIALARYAGAERDAQTELGEAQTLLQNAENAWQAGRDGDTVDIAARRSISAAVKAENLAVERRKAREQRNEKIRSDAEIRAAENKYVDAQAEIADLKESLARETRNRELAERDVLNYSQQVKDLREQNRRVSEDLGRAKTENEDLNRRLNAALTAIENQKREFQAQQDKQAQADAIRNAEPSLMDSLKAVGTVVKNERGIVLTLPDTIWTGARTSAFVPQADSKLSALAAILTKNTNYRVSIESSLDNAGDSSIVQRVTDQRAYAIASKLVDLGVEEGRIVAKGLGATMPLVPNTTAANKAKNRRVQVILSLYVQ